MLALQPWEVRGHENEEHGTFSNGQYFVLWRMQWELQVFLAGNSNSELLKSQVPPLFSAQRGAKITSEPNDQEFAAPTWRTMLASELNAVWLPTKEAAESHLQPACQCCTSSLTWWSCWLRLLPGRWEPLS